MGRHAGMADIGDGKHSVAGELKKTGQRLLTAHLGITLIMHTLLYHSGKMLTLSMQDAAI